LPPEPVLQCADLSHRPIDVVLRIADLTADRKVSEDVVEEDVGELKACADLKPGRGGLIAAEFGQVRAQRRQPLIGRACRLRGLVDLGIEGRPVGGGAEAILNVGQRLDGGPGIVVGPV